MNYKASIINVASQSGIPDELKHEIIGTLLDKYEVEVRHAVFNKAIDLARYYGRDESMPDVHKAMRYLIDSFEILRDRT